MPIENRVRGLTQATLANRSSPNYSTSEPSDLEEFPGALAVGVESLKRGLAGERVEPVAVARVVPYYRHHRLEVVADRYHRGRVSRRR